MWYFLTSIVQYDFAAFQHKHVENHLRLCCVTKNYYKILNFYHGHTRTQHDHAGWKNNVGWLTNLLYIYNNLLLSNNVTEHYIINAYVLFIFIIMRATITITNKYLK